MNLSIIVARSQNNVIGYKNGLPWHLTDDLKNFKKITLGHPIIMGRKTFESIGRPLPGRTNIVVTRQTDLQISGCELVNSLEAALDLGKSIDEVEVFVIGGADLINQSLSLVNRIYLTEVKAQIEGDTYLKNINLDNWKTISQKDFLITPGGNEYDFSIIEYAK